MVVEVEVLEEGAVVAAHADIAEAQVMVGGVTAPVVVLPLLDVAVCLLLFVGVATAVRLIVVVKKLHMLMEMVSGIDTEAGARMCAGKTISKTFRVVFLLLLELLLDHNCVSGVNYFVSADGFGLTCPIF